MAQKQKWFLIIAGLIFLGSAFLLTHGLTAKAQSNCVAKGEVCLDSNSCCNTSDRCLVFGYNTIKKCCDTIPGESYLHGFNTCCGYEALFIGNPNEYRCVKNKPGEFVLGDYCTESAQCASKNCCGNKCVDKGPSVPPQCPDSKVCFNIGQGCIPGDIKNNCCSPYICDPKDNICKPDPIISGCKVANDSCVLSSDCCSPNVCVNYFCKPCLGLGIFCSSHSQCCSGNCPPFDTLIYKQSACGLPLPGANQFGLGGEFTPSVGLTITSPNGGESWQVGQLYQIKWKTQGPENLISIAIWNYDYVDQTSPQAYKIIATNNNKPVKGAQDQGGTNMSYPWEIQTDFFTSNGIWKSTDNLKIIVTETTQFGGQAGKDTSDGYFNIVLPPERVKTCADCDNGIFNLCNKNECFGIDPHCLFSSYIVGGKCSPGGCATDQECATTMSCESEYLTKCDSQKRSCSCVPVITEQKISFKITTDNGQAVSQANIKVFDSQLKQVGSCATGQNGSCVTNELIPIGYGSEAFPTKSYSTQVSAQGFFTNSNVNFDAVLNMLPVAVSLYKNTQTTFKVTLDLNSSWGVIVGISKKGESQAVPQQECFAINPPEKCTFSLENGAYRAFIIDYQFCWDDPGGCFTDFEINNSDIVVNLVAKMTKVIGSPSPYCSRTDGGDEYTKGAVRRITSVPTGEFTSIIDHCVANTNFSYIPSLEGPSVAQYDCNGWPKLTSCPAGCYDGACLINCPNMSSTFGGFCAKEDAIDTVCSQADKISHQFLSDSFCDKQGGNFCVFCAKPCNTKDDCGYLTNCPNNETKITEPACGADKKCFCKNLTCQQDSECVKTITCQTDQTPICEIKDIYGTTIKPKECFCLDNTSQKRILVHVDDNYTSEDLPGISVSILDKGSQVASCVTSDPRGKCTIPALTFSPEHSYTAVVRGESGYKDAEIKLVFRSNTADVSANFHLLSSASDVVTCKQNKECASFPCSGGKNPTCYKQQCECQGGSVLPYKCSSDSNCTSMCASGQKQICGSDGQCKCATATCLDCGNGILNVCDEKECLAFGPDCVFNKGFLATFGNNCFNKAQCEFACSGTDKVCGSDGIVYANKCMAQCNKKTFVPGDCSIPVTPPPVIPPPGGQIIKSTQGGTVEMSKTNLSIKLIISPNTFTEDVAVAIEPMPKNDQDFANKAPFFSIQSSSNTNLLGPFMFHVSIKTLKGVAIHNFSKPITVVTKYSKSGLGLNDEQEKALRIVLFSAITNNYEILKDTVVNPTEQTLTAQTIHFSNVAIAADCDSAPKEMKFCGPCKVDSDPNKQCETSLECSNKAEPASGQCMPIGQIAFCPITTHTSFECLINSLSKWLFYLALVIAPLMILLGGFYMLTAAGEPARSTKGKTILTWAIIGLAVILAAKAFISIITSVLK